MNQITKFFVVDYRLLNDIKIAEYPTEEEARTNCPSEGGASVVTSEEALRAFDGPILVAVYNRIRRGAMIKRFESKEAGVRRVWVLLENYDPALINPSASPEVPKTEPTTGEAAGDKEEADMAAKTKSKRKSAGRGVKKTSARARSSDTKRARISDDAKITVLAAENPKKPGSEAFKRFEKYRTGSKVSTTLANGVTRADLSWDRAHGFIAIENPKE